MLPSQPCASQGEENQLSPLFGGAVELLDLLWDMGHRADESFSWEDSGKIKTQLSKGIKLLLLPRSLAVLKKQNTMGFHPF